MLSHSYVQGYAIYSYVQVRAFWKLSVPSQLQEGWFSAQAILPLSAHLIVFSIISGCHSYKTR